MKFCILQYIINFCENPLVECKAIIIKEHSRENFSIISPTHNKTFFINYICLDFLKKNCANLRFAGPPSLILKFDRQL